MYVFDVTVQTSGSYEKPHTFMILMSSDMHSHSVYCILISFSTFYLFCSKRHRKLKPQRPTIMALTNFIGWKSATRTHWSSHKSRVANIIWQIHCCCLSDYVRAMMFGLKTINKSRENGDLLQHWARDARKKKKNDASSGWLIKCLF